MMENTTQRWSVYLIRITATRCIVVLPMMLNEDSISTKPEKERKL